MIDPDWYAELRRRLDAPPERPRLPLRLLTDAGSPIAGRTIGSIESSLALDLAGAGLPMRDAGDGWVIEAPVGAARPDALLATIAETLRRLGRAAAWRDELLAVTGPDGERLGAIERAAVRPLGIATVAVHLVAARSGGGVWVQQRAFDKSTDPGLWDTTMGGLVAAGESPEVAFERETREEAGLEPTMLRDRRTYGRFTVRRPVTHGYMVEHTTLVEATVEPDRVPANQDGEVERFECIDRAELLARLHAGRFTLEAAMALALWIEHRPG